MGTRRGWVQGEDGDKMRMEDCEDGEDGDKARKGTRRRWEQGEDEDKG